MYLYFGLSGFLFVVSIIFFLGNALIYHWITIGGVTQIAIQSLLILTWTWNAHAELSFFTQEVGRVKDALDLVKVKSDMLDKKGANPIRVNPEHSEIRFNNLCFSHQKNSHLFEKLNVVIHSKERIGLMGLSGTGKSTFINLILRCYDPSSGSIFINNQNIAEVTQDSLHSIIGIIPQNPILFHRSIMENIRYGNLAASDEDVILASKRACCDKFIANFDEGYNSLVGEGGAKLSLGQRQRISIARAFLKNAPILLIDEATSSLDHLTEKRVQRSLNFLMKDKTTIMISHRKSTLSNMDRILSIRNGLISELPV